jgi:predicted permease
MVTLEIAASVMLVVVSGLLVRSFVQLKQAPLGFDPSQVVTARLALGHGPYADESRRRQFWETLQREVESHPAVAATGLAWPLPFTGLGAEVPYDSVDGVAGGGRFVAFLASAWPGYFQTIDATVLDGRTFDERDLDRASSVAVVDRRTAEQLYPAASAVGRPVWFEDYATRQRRSVEIIGVVDQIRHARLSGPEREMIYLLNPQARNLGLVVRLRQSQAAASILPELRTLTAAIDPNVPLFEARSLQSYVDDVVAPTRFTMTLAGGFGLVALLMAAVGLYGVVSYGVSQRSAEFGLRMALGASAPAIFRLVMSQGLGMAAVGVGAGLVGAIAAAATVRRLLTDVSPGDPATFTATTVVLAAVVLAASYLPARRAARLDPARTLRGE